MLIMTDFQVASEHRDLWNQASIPSTSLLSVGDSLFRTFKLVDAHMAKPSNASPSLSYLDFGFGQDQSSFAGCHRLQIVRNMSLGDSSADEGLRNQTIDLSIECFIYDPKSAVFDQLGWIHTMYVELLFANGVQACLRSR